MVLKGPVANRVKKQVKEKVSENRHLDGSR